MDYTELELPVIIECIEMGVIQSHSIRDDGENIEVSLSISKSNIDQVLEYIKVSLQEKELSDKSSKIWQNLKDQRNEAGQKRISFYAWDDDDEKLDEATKKADTE